MISFAYSTQFVHLLFEEVDQDGSGAIDKSEFRALLKKLNLSYR
jgi:Ca2+-binding EF-hand superfamily protein